MARRRGNDEIAFGSDSFLDIVANIVGSLIILIVIAGVRVSQMPAVTARAIAEKAPQPVEAPPVLSVVPPTPEPTPAPVEHKPLPTPPAPATPTKPPEPIKPPPELLARIEAAASRLARLEQSKAELATTLDQGVAVARTLEQQVEASQSAAASEQQKLENGRQTIASLQTELEAEQRQIAGLHLTLADVQAAQPPPQEIRHKLTPVGKVVQGTEIHFLLSRNRVVVVPTEDLAEKLKEEILRKKNQFLRGHMRVGSVGPVKGFTMEYVVEREAVSLRTELQMRATGVRLSVTEYRIIPQSSAIYESADEAMLPRSRFLGALRQAGSDASVTFWVYPDSFALFRQLQDFAHDNAFDVAGRPLPFGIPITGSSTNGARSVAQ